MVNFFKELEYPDNFYLDLVLENNVKDTIDLPINEKYLEKIIKLIKIINSYDLLNDNNMSFKPIYLSYDEYSYDYSFSYDIYMNYHDLSNSGLTKYGQDKIEELKHKYEETYKGLDFKEYFFTYMSYLKTCVHFRYEEVIDGEYENNIFDAGILKNKYDIMTYLKSSIKLAKFQNKLKKEDEELYRDIVNYFNNNKFLIEKKKYIEYKYKLPNAWYITPYNHLYNPTCDHGEACLTNLFYSMNLNIDDPDYVTARCEYDSYSLLTRINKALCEGYITRSDWLHFVNRYDFVSIYPDDYDNMSKIDQEYYDFALRRTYNPKNVKIVVGIMSAQAALLNKFKYLKEHSNNYKNDFNNLLKMESDDLLIRFCGFHKISSVQDKTITTSDVNWKNNFKEYIEKGWYIDFVKPIVLNNGKLEELSDDFLKIKKYHI